MNHPNKKKIPFYHQDNVASFLVEVSCKISILLLPLLIINEKANGNAIIENGNLEVAKYSAPSHR